MTERDTDPGGLRRAAERVARRDPAVTAERGTRTQALGPDVTSATATDPRQEQE